MIILVITSNVHKCPLVELTDNYIAQICLKINAKTPSATMFGPTGGSDIKTRYPYQQAGSFRKVGRTLTENDGVSHRNYITTVELGNGSRVPGTI